MAVTIQPSLKSEPQEREADVAEWPQMAPYLESTPHGFSSYGITNADGAGRTGGKPSLREKMRGIFADLLRMNSKEADMPFESEKQRRWMHANEPEMAARWEREKKQRKSKGEPEGSAKEAVLVYLEKEAQNPIHAIMDSLGRHGGILGAPAFAIGRGAKEIGTRAAGGAKNLGKHFGASVRDAFTQPTSVSYAPASSAPADPGGGGGESTKVGLLGAMKHASPLGDSLGAKGVGYRRGGTGTKSTGTIKDLKEEPIVPDEREGEDTGESDEAEADKVARYLMAVVKG